MVHISFMAHNGLSCVDALFKRYSLSSSRNDILNVIITQSVSTGLGAELSAKRSVLDNLKFLHRLKPQLIPDITTVKWSTTR